MSGRKSEQIVVVDEHDVVLGTEEKDRCHDGEGILHRGFLAMIFDATGALLLTRRSAEKRLWPGYWDGSVASHVLEGEDYVQASRRRLREELGIDAPGIEYSFKFRYKVGYGSAGTEHEICAVTIARGIPLTALSADEREISEVRSVDLKALIEQVRSSPDGYTPWLVLALDHISERPASMAREYAVRETTC